MHAKSAAAVALLAAAPIVQAGNAVIKNQCNFPVYLWTVSNYAGAMQTLSTGDHFSQGYQTNPDGGGISMKVATTPDLGGEVTQFEYTLTDTLWYDMSNINGNPFAQWGMSLVPSDSSCRSVLCPAGETLCHAAYNTPDENYATAACGTSADTTLVLCSGQNNSNIPATGAQALDTEAKKHHIKHHKHHHKHHDKHHNKHHKAAPAPAPAPAAPAVPAVPNVAGALTTFVTQIVTVTARAAEPTAA